MDNEPEEYINEESEAYESLCREPKQMVSPQVIDSYIDILFSC